MPIGVLAFPIYWRNFTLRDLKFLLLFSVILATAIQTSSGLFELALLGIGPLIAVILRTMDLSELSQNAISLLLLILLLDALVAGFLTSGLRGGSILTKEPSHSARVFYTVLFIKSLIGRGSGWVGLCFGSIFLLINKSSSGLLFFLFYIGFLLFRRGFRSKAFVLGVSGSFLVFLAIFYVPIEYLSSLRFYQTVEAVIHLLAGTTSRDSVELAQYVGGRRLTQSIAGFMASSWNGVGLGESVTVFLGMARDAGFDIAKIGRIAERAQSPTSYFSQIAFEAGLLRFALCLVLIVYAFRPSKNQILTFLFAFFQLFFLSTTTTPFPWIFLGLSCNTYGVYCGRRGIGA